MKDAYSFDRDEAGARESYQGMYDARSNLCARMGLKFRAVAADTGNIGGNASHEFQVIADTGEDAIAYCPTSDYAANVEMAEALPLIAERAAPAGGFARLPHRVRKSAKTWRSCSVFRWRARSNRSCWQSTSRKRPARASGWFWSAATTSSTKSKSAKCRIKWWISLCDRG